MPSPIDSLMDEVLKRIAPTSIRPTSFTGNSFFAAANPGNNNRLGKSPFETKPLTLNNGILNQAPFGTNGFTKPAPFNFGNSNKQLKLFSGQNGEEPSMTGWGSAFL